MKTLDAADGAEVGLRILADVIQAVADRDRSTVRAVPTSSQHPIVSRNDWMHGLVPCSGCGLPLDAQRDRDDYLWSPSESKSYGVTGTHRRCGQPFQLEFADASAKR